ncbi:response regulator transcription factor [Pelomonas sp. KK5]|uniref:response regulator transcription factor n=1 Tax=Pelomonas sp. KK5 TaxID=1855730 RepID=UPI00097C567E|nr:response regulator [Pelomonas sp. KK5]
MPTIAVIEDDLAMNDQHRRMLTEIPDAQVHQAFNTAQAQRLIDSMDFDLLVLDIELEPGAVAPKGGIDLLARYGATKTIIIVTGMPEQNLHEISLQLKAFEFVRKPVNPTDFLNKVKHALALRDLQAFKAASGRKWPDGLSTEANGLPGFLWNKRPVNLSIIELKMVHLLAQAPGRTVGYTELTEVLKSGNSTRVVHQHMSNVRQHFRDVDPDFDRIGTDPMKGYVWKVD